MLTGPAGDKDPGRKTGSSKPFLLQPGSRLRVPLLAEPERAQLTNQMFALQDHRTDRAGGFELRDNNHLPRPLVFKCTDSLISCISFLQHRPQPLLVSCATVLFLVITLNAQETHAPSFQDHGLGSARVPRTMNRKWTLGKI